MLSIKEKILTLNSLRLLPVAALRFTFYALHFLPVPQVMAAATAATVTGMLHPLHLLRYVVFRGGRCQPIL